MCTVYWDIPLPKNPLDSYHWGCLVAHFLCLFVFVYVCVCVENTISRHVKIISNNRNKLNWSNLKFLCRAWMRLMTMMEKRRRVRREKILRSTTLSRTRHWPLTPEQPTRYRWRECLLVISEDNPASRGCRVQSPVSLTEAVLTKETNTIKWQTESRQSTFMLHRATIHTAIITLDTRHDGVLSFIYLVLFIIYL